MGRVLQPLDREDGLLSHTADEHRPKVFYTNTGYEYWGRAASLLHTDWSGKDVEPLPGDTALGSLSRHLVDSDPKRFQPANVNYGLFPPLNVRASKRERRTLYAARAQDSLRAWSNRTGLPVALDSSQPELPSTPAAAQA